VANGTNDVIVMVEGQSFSTVSGVLNGFDVTANPEPSSALLCGVGTMLLVGYGSFRRAVRHFSSKKQVRRKTDG
jgi:hypothetical protein